MLVAGGCARPGHGRRYGSVREPVGPVRKRCGTGAGARGAGAGPVWGPWGRRRSCPGPQSGGCDGTAQAERRRPALGPSAARGPAGPSRACPGRAGPRTGPFAAVRPPRPALLPGGAATGITFYLLCGSNSYWFFSLIR